VHYSIEERQSSSGKVVFHSEKQGHKYLALVSMKLHILFIFNKSFLGVKLNFNIDKRTNYYNLDKSRSLDQILVQVYCIVGRNLIQR